MNPEIAILRTSQPNFLMRIAGLLIFCCALVLNALGDEVANSAAGSVTEYIATLNQGTRAELPVRVVALVRQVKPAERRAAILNVIRAAIAVNPAATTAVVSSLARAFPALAPLIAATAAKAQPAQAVEIARVAAAVSTPLAEEIRRAVCQVAPELCEKIFVAIPQGVRNATAPPGGGQASFPPGTAGGGTGGGPPPPYKNSQ